MILEAVLLGEVGFLNLKVISKYYLKKTHRLVLVFNY